MNTKRLSQRIEKLKTKPNINSDTLESIKNWLLTIDTWQRFRINPYNIAQKTEIDVEQIISHLLQGVFAGLFDLHWDIHCPHCNGIANEYDNLSEATAHSFCGMCDVEFESDFLKRVEVTFSLNKEIENLNLPLICAPPPSVEPRFVMDVAKDQTAVSQEILEEGIYQYNCPITTSKGTLIVKGKRIMGLQVVKLRQLDEQKFDQSTIEVQPGLIRIELTNDSHYPISGLWIAEKDLPELTDAQIPRRLSGLALLHYPEFRQLFGEQVLSERERLKISSVTIMFTDITGSTQMYERLGDAVAYNIVRDHFEILFKSIEKHKGTILKTIGDAVMASFIANEHALLSVVDALKNFKLYNQNRPLDEQVNIKIGIHRGATILVNLNERLDYFGSSVNRTARIQGQSQSNEIAFSEEIYQDSGFVKILQENGLDKVTEHNVNLRGIEGTQKIYKVRFA